MALDPALAQGTADPGKLDNSLNQGFLKIGFKSLIGFFTRGFSYKLAKFNRFLKTS